VTTAALPPASVPAPLEGKPLLQFLQNWIVGISGLPGGMVRPRWQVEQPNIPNSGDAWAAIGITSRPSDTLPFIAHDPNDEGTSTLQRNEELHMLCSFYDTGISGLADQYAALTRDGIAIPQNCELLRQNGFALGYSGDLQTIPSLLSTKWLYRVDLPLVVRRQIDRVYAVKNILSANGTVYTDEGYSFPIAVNPPE
jgi:hypothetical protein